MKRAVVVAVVMLCWLSCIQMVMGQAPRPPLEPLVKPLIGKMYPNDENGDKIADVLLSRSIAAEELARLAVTVAEKQKATQRLKEMVDVELVFEQQITQQQIDEFLALEGEIAYVYKAVSYGWNGRIPLNRITDLPGRLGASLRLVEEPAQAVLHMDMATRTGRVRPIWSSGFAGNPSGYDGNTNITIAIVDTGVDESHSDLNGRRVYWNDFTTDGEASPIDYDQHGSHVAGIALGTGQAGGSGTATMHYTQIGSLSGVPSGSFYPSAISLPTATVNFSSTAQWLDGGSTTLYHVYQDNGGGSWYSAGSASGSAPLNRTSSITGSSSRHYSPALLSNGSMSDFVVVSQVTSYPGIGDGFNKFRGVAPGCSWAGAKVFTHDGTGYTTWTGAAVDALVASRVANNIKVMNLSLGTNGDPGISTSNRQKINTAVNNGIVAVISAGNDGNESTSGAREVDDPGRAAMALTVAAANDINQITDYTSHGFTSPSSTPGQEEDYKPDVTAPGGSGYHTPILSVDSNSGDGTSFPDQQANDYYNIKGTSMASPFVAGCAALVVDALQQQGITWDFTSSQHARYVKMLICASANESNTDREDGNYNPTLQRAAVGSGGYPSGKDLYEGYGLINPDAAIEAVALNILEGDSYSLALGASFTDRRASARQVELQAGQQMTVSLNVPATGDFDLYLYSGTPSAYGTPMALATSTLAGSGTDELITYTPSSTSTGIIVVKRVSGSGSFTLDWLDATPPSCTITRDDANPTAAAVVHFSVEFSENVVGFEQADVDLTGTAPGKSITGFSGSGSNYTVIVGGIIGSGTVAIDMDAEKCTDAAGNPNTAGASVGYDIDQTAPVITSITSTNANGTYGEGQPIDVTLTFSESVTLVGGDLVIALETGDTDREVLISTIANTNIASGVYTVQAGDASADLSVNSISLGGTTLQDALGNDADLSIPPGQNLDDDKDIVVETMHTITASKTGNGTINPEGAVTVVYNGTTNFLIQASTNYHIASIMTNGVHIAGSPYSDNSFAATNYVWSNITADGTIAAGFEINQHILTVISAYGGTDPGSETADWGTVLSQYVTNSPVSGGVGTQHVCVAGTVVGNDYSQVGPTQVNVMLTNSATLTWNWQTQYWLDAEAGANGAVGVSDQWVAAGSNVVITAAASNHYHFSHWSGNTNGCGIADNVLTAPMDQPRQIMANFAIDRHTLEIVSAYGALSPTAGIYTNDYGTALTNTVSSPDTQGTVQYACTGWSMEGNEPVGGATNVMAMILTNNSSLVWLWGTNYYLNATSGLNGSVAASNGWHSAGATNVVTAIPDPTYSFIGWSGDIASTNNPLTLVMTQAYAVVANFTDDLDGDGLPNWWEIQYYGGTTNAIATATCSNGVNTVLEAYIAGLDPTDLSAGFVLYGYWNELWWNGVSGRVYDVWWSSNLLNGFEPLETNLPWTPAAYTDTVHAVEDEGFYKLDVKMQ